jgi:Transposase
VKRRYTDEERGASLAALAANAGNVKRTARELGIPEVTLRHWSTGSRHPEAVTMGAQKKGPLADKLEEVAWALAGKLPGSDCSDVQATAVALGILVDKLQVLRGLPSSITGATHDEKLGRLRRILGIPPAS